MLNKIYNGNWFDYRNFIIDNEKNLSINPIEAHILINLLDKYKISNEFDKEELKNNINVSNDSFDKALSSLLSKELFEIYLNDKDGKSYEAFNMDGFFSRCEAILNGKISINEDELFVIIKLISKAINKVLSSNEIEIVKSLYIEDKYTIDNFKQAIKNLDNKRVKNIKTLTIELESIRNKPIKNETPEFLKEFINKVK